MYTLSCLFITIICLLSLGLYNKRKYFLNVITVGLLLAMGLFFYDASNALKALSPSAYTADFHYRFIRNHVLIFLVLLTSLAVFITISKKSLFYRLADSAEALAVMLFAVLGAIIMLDFKTLPECFIGVEMLSLALYILIGLNSTHGLSSEASIKYFLSGSVFSAIFLLGLVFLYGASGSMQIEEIRTLLINKLHGLESGLHIIDSYLLFYVGLVFVFVALAFKMGLVPFHLWLPDVYQGAPLSVTLFMSTVVKIAVLGVWVQLLDFMIYSYVQLWSFMLVTLILASAIVSNIFALRQSSFKRLMAFSSISHTCYLMSVLITDCAHFSDSLVFFYILSYVAANVIIFTVASIIPNAPSKDLTIDAFKGLFIHNKTLAVCMVVALLSLAGLPLTMGFVAKVTILTNLFRLNYFLTPVLVITSIISIYYYFKLISAILFKDASHYTYIQSNNEDKFFVSRAQLICLTFLCLLIVICGCFPALMVDLIDSIYSCILA